MNIKHTGRGERQLPYTALTTVHCSFVPSNCWHCACTMDTQLSSLRMWSSVITVTNSGEVFLLACRLQADASGSFLIIEWRVSVCARRSCTSRLKCMHSYLIFTWHCVQLCVQCRQMYFTSMHMHKVCKTLLRSRRYRIIVSEYKKNHTSRWYELHLHNDILISSLFIIALVVTVRVVIQSAAVQATGNKVNRQGQKICSNVSWQQDASVCWKQ